MDNLPVNSRESVFKSLLWRRTPVFGLVPGLRFWRFFTFTVVNINVVMSELLGWNLFKHLVEFIHLLLVFNGHDCWIRNRGQQAGLPVSSGCVSELWSCVSESLLGLRRCSGRKGTETQRVKMAQTERSIRRKRREKNAPTSIAVCSFHSSVQRAGWSRTQFAFSNCPH